jgi:N-acetylglucosamine-6-phosphate deacetylase
MEQTQKTFTAKHIFTGDEWLKDHSIIVNNGWIEDIVPSTTTAEHDTILPAFIDLQIYGAYGKLFSAFPTDETLSLIHQYCYNGGAYWFQPTVATNTFEIFKKAIDGVRSYWKNGGEGCIGLHIEGPWINKAKRGAHIDELVHSPSVEEVKELLEYGKGVITMITLAPEVCSKEVINVIEEYNVIISVGHSNIKYQAANEFFDRGITVVTHLYNAMSGLNHREPGLVGAAFNNKNAMASIIADGHHVDYAAIKIAHHLMKDRLFLITDAVTETSEGAYQHYLAGDKYEAGRILSGSALTMMQAVKNMIDFAGVDKADAIRMACAIPAKVVRMENKIGKLAKGYAARFVIPDEVMALRNDSGSL